MKTEKEKAWEEFTNSLARLAELGAIQAGEKLNVKAENYELDVKVIRVARARVQQEQQRHSAAREEAYFISSPAFV